MVDGGDVLNGHRATIEANHTTYSSNGFIPTSPKPHISAETSVSQRLIFNICGSRYEILDSTLQRYPQTLLADPERRLKFWDQEHKEFFLDRNRACFKAALLYYQSHGCLVKPDGVPEIFFFDEMDFYGVRKRKPKHEREMPKNEVQKRVWSLFEYPDTSNGARVLAWFSCAIVLLSIALFCVETLPMFHNNEQQQQEAISTSGDQVVVKNGDEDDEKSRVFFIMEAICIAWFTTEYLIRLISSPCKRKFILGALNVIDLLAILPFFISFALNDQDTNVSSMAVIRAIRLVRVFRIFKLSRYSKGLKILGMTLKASLTELGLLSFFLAVGVILFSSAIYYAELEQNGEVFASIPHAFWWAIVTMTTVGYGDMYPITLAGKFVGSLCAFTGILAIALPVPVIVANFEHFYNNENENQEVKITELTNGRSRFHRLRKFLKNVRRRRQDLHPENYSPSTNV